MRADRLLGMLLLLDDHRRMTAGALAERLEVSTRTIYRDLDALSAAGVPIYAERGNGGACCLPQGYRVRLNGLSEAEVQALSLAAPARILSDLGLTEHAAAAARKLIRALPDALRSPAESARSRILVDASGWDAPSEPVSQLGALQQAVWHDQRVAIDYTRADGTSVERMVDPLGLVAKGSVWYLVASVGGQVRTYRAARVSAVRPTGEAASRPAGFELASFWRESSAAFKAALPRFTVQVRVTAQAVESVRNARRVRIESEAPPAEDGRVVMELTFDTEAEAQAFALGHGLDVEVLEPAALRQAVAHVAAEVAMRYGRPLRRARHSGRSRRMS
ncbi:MAG TPA: YafY family protein [Chloroflexota bacterium]